MALAVYAFSPDMPLEEMQARVFHELITDLEQAKEVFGYEAVYFGVGCEVFPDAVDPGWDGQY
jgi:hypothetical protein